MAEQPKNTMDCKGQNSKRKSIKLRPRLSVNSGQVILAGGEKTIPTNRND